jgi:hypothetical protein
VKIADKQEEGERGKKEGELTSISSDDKKNSFSSFPLPPLSLSLSLSLSLTRSLSLLSLLSVCLSSLSLLSLFLSTNKYAKEK